MQRLADLSAWQVALATAVLTAAIELVTIFLRFGLGLKAAQVTAWLARFTFGLRIHHAYIGALVLVASVFAGARPSLMNALLMLGASLVLSDLVHHFLILWPITGSPEFHLTYGRRE